jgi:hypothetical protein
MQISHTSYGVSRIALRQHRFGPSSDCETTSYCRVGPGAEVDYLGAFRQMASRRGQGVWSRLCARPGERATLSSCSARRNAKDVDSQWNSGMTAIWRCGEAPPNPYRPSWAALAVVLKTLAAMRIWACAAPATIWAEVVRRIGSCSIWLIPRPVTLPVPQGMTVRRPNPAVYGLANTWSSSQNLRDLPLDNIATAHE